MLKDEERSFVVLALPFYNSLSLEEQQGLENQIVFKTFRKGESMHRGSEDCAGLFLVKTGHIRVFMLSESGKEITLYRLFSRDICIFSASCMLADINFDVFIEAEVETQALVIPAEEYFSLQKKVPAVSNYTTGLLSSRFSEVMWVMEQVMFQSFDRRLAGFLLNQSAIEESDTLKITHETIAKHLGSAREVVTRMLNYFQEEGMVTLSRGGITITDRKKIQQLD